MYVLVVAISGEDVVATSVVAKSAPSTDRCSAVKQAEDIVIPPLDFLMNSYGSGVERICHACMLDCDDVSA